MPEAGGNDEIAPAPLVPIGNLTRQNGLQAFCRHSRPSQDALSLQKSRCRNDDNGVAGPVRSRFKQERYVQDGDRASAPRRAAKELLLALENQGVKNALKAPQGFGILENQIAQAGAIHGTV
jgi:hypothetical protein